MLIRKNTLGQYKQKTKISMNTGKRLMEAAFPVCWAREAERPSTRRRTELPREEGLREQRGLGSTWGWEMEGEQA